MGQVSVPCSVKQDFKSCFLNFNPSPWLHERHARQDCAQSSQARAYGTAPSASAPSSGSALELRRADTTWQAPRLRQSDVMQGPTCALSAQAQK